VGHLGAAAGVPGAAGEVLLEAVDAAAEEVLAAVGEEKERAEESAPSLDAPAVVGCRGEGRRRRWRGRAQGRGEAARG
jgi:hypothetical protein